MSTRVDHAAEADRLRQLANDYEIAHPSSDTPGEALTICAAVANGYAHAQVYATLALIEQQRIANLIAYVAKWNDDEVLDIDAEIREALGLS